MHVCVFHYETTLQSLGNVLQEAILADIEWGLALFLPSFFTAHGRHTHLWWFDLLQGIAGGEINPNMDALMDGV